MKRGDAMEKTAKVTISLDEELYAAVEKEREESGENRSQIFRRAVELLLRQRLEREKSERYVRAYQAMPETQEEVQAARRAASAILAEEPWE